MKIYCIYHKDCLDGFASALAIYIAFEYICSDMTFIPMTYGEEPPQIDPDSIVYIVDFSFKSTILKEMAKDSKVVVIDHHISAIRELISGFEINLPVSDMNQFKFEGEVSENIKLVLDTSHSGAMLTYNYINSEMKNVTSYIHLIPDTLFWYVEDRDLWRFDGENTRAYTRYLTTLKWDFIKWKKTANLQPSELRNIIAIGGVLLDDDKLKIEWHLKNAMRVIDLRETLKQIDLEGTGLSMDDLKEIPLVNVPKYLVSETLNELVDKYPFVMGYHEGSNGVVYRFNSSAKGPVDVSVLATRLGGGGHRNAAGLTLKKSILL